MLKIIAICAFATALLTTHSASSNWAKPFSGENPKWDNDYVAPEASYGPGHRGVDLAIETKSPITAPISGWLAFSDEVVDRPVVTIRSTTGYLVTFEPACTELKPGDRVRAGTEIAWHCSPKREYRYHCQSCVHLSVRSEFGYLSPDYFLTQMPASRLLG